MKECLLIDKTTGEIIFDDYKIMEFEDKQKQQNILEKIKSDDEFKMYIDKNLGSFYFLFYRLLGKGIEKQYITRFLYLCTYMNYENKLLFGNAKGDDKYMIEKDLQEVWNLSERDIIRTKKSLTHNDLIKIDKNKTIMINEKYCLKGKIEDNKKKRNKVRIFENGIRELYEKATSREHKKLALLIEILPYINLKYNIICENPHCENKNEIKPISLSKLTEILGFSTTQKLKKGLFDVSVGGEKVIAMFIVDQKSMILINPRIYYKGTQLDDIKYLMNLFDISKNI